MMRLGLLLPVLVAVALATPVAAQAPRATPTTSATLRKLHVSNLANPANRSTNRGTMSGQGCISGTMANRAQLEINPVTGKPHAAPIVALPLGKGSGSIADATTRAQQAHACAHGR